MHPVAAGNAHAGRAARHALLHACGDWQATPTRGARSENRSSFSRPHKALGAPLSCSSAADPPPQRFDQRDAVACIHFLSAPAPFVSTSVPSALHRDSWQSPLCQRGIGTLSRWFAGRSRACAGKARGAKRVLEGLRGSLPWSTTRCSRLARS